MDSSQNAVVFLHLRHKKYHSGVVNSIQQIRYVLTWLIALAIGCTAYADESFQLSWDDPRALYQGEYTFDRSDTPPNDDASWESIALPDIWWERPPMTEDRAWYRFPVGTDGIPEKIWGIYAWRYGMNIRIYFNEDLLVDGGSFEEPVARNLHRPMLAKIPVSAWREGENYIYVHLRGWPNYGHLLPLGAGPYEAFEAPYAERYFLQIELSKYLFVVTWLVALLALAFWLVDRKNTAYAYLAGACVSWSLFSLNPIIQDLPFSNLTWMRMLHTSMDLFGYLLMMFVHRQLNHRAPILERLVLSFVVAAGIFYWLQPIQTITRSSSLVHLITNGIAVYLMWFTLRHYLRTRDPEGLLYFCMLLVLIGVSLHDLLLLSGAAEDLWVTNFLAFNLGAPAVFVVLIIYLTWRIGRENAYWEARVKQVTGQLEDEFVARERLERNNAAAEERERIYRDLHDDLGSKLLSMVYSAEQPQQADAAREALRDMRAIIDRSSESESDLAALTADWRHEASQRLDEAGLQSVWNQAPVSGEISVEASYQLTRVLRELTSNAIRHSGADQVSYRIAIEEGELVIQIQDDGAGMPETPRYGRGIEGSSQRMESIGASIQWKSDSSGTRVTIRFPLNRGYERENP